MNNGEDVVSKEVFLDTQKKGAEKLRFQILNDWYDLVLNVMIWGWGMPASLWYFSGSFLAFFAGVDLTQQTLPYFNDTLQAAIFLIF